MVVSHNIYLPNPKELNKEILGKTGEEHLANDVDVGSEGRFEHDWHVRSVEELDWVRATLAAETVALDWNLDAEALKVNDDGKHGKSGDKIHHVRKALSPESFSKGTAFVVPSKKKVEEGNDGTLKLRPTASIDSGGRKRLPDDRLTDVGGDEERDTRAKTITLLKEFVK
jgi:hypothetical protein